MTDHRAAKRYAKALFQASLREGVVAAVDDDLKALTETLKGSDSLRRFIFSPITNEADKVALWDRTLAGKANPLTIGLLKLATAKGRDIELFAIQLEFSELRRQHDQIVKAVFESAVELDSGTRQSLVTKVEQLSGHKVEAEFKIDPSLIGGVKVTYDNMVLDGTARGHLNRLKENFLRDALKQS